MLPLAAPKTLKPFWHTPSSLDLPEVERSFICRTFLQRCCYDCLKEITISAYTLEHRYGVPADKLEGLPHYAKDMRTDW